MERFEALADEAVKGRIGREPARRPGLPPEIDNCARVNGA
jgi:hypothetical protein